MGTVAVIQDDKAKSSSSIAAVQKPMGEVTMTTPTSHCSLWLQLCLELVWPSFGLAEWLGMLKLAVLLRFLLSQLLLD